jgi:hypothetical protein
LAARLAVATSDPHIAERYNQMALEQFAKAEGRPRREPADRTTAPPWTASTRSGLIVMDDDRGRRAKECRKQAAACLEVAGRMSIIADRDLMMQMAQQWLELARQAEVEEE